MAEGASGTVEGPAAPARSRRPGTGKTHNLPEREARFPLAGRPAHVAGLARLAGENVVRLGRLKGFLGAFFGQKWIVWNF